MSMMVMNEFRVKPDQVDNFMAFGRSEYDGTRGFEGCEFLATYQLQGDPHTFVVVTRWLSEAHHEQYLAWRAETPDVMQRLLAMLDGQPSIRYLDQVIP